MSDALDVIDPGITGSVTLGDGDDAVQVSIQPLTVIQLPGFTRAVQPILEEATKIAGGNLDLAAIASLVETHFEPTVRLLAVATVRPLRGESPDAIESRLTQRADDIRFATMDQALALMVEVLGANRDFLERLLHRVQQVTQLIGGTGPTPSSA